jgi:hypothetical protein
MWFLHSVCTHAYLYEIVWHHDQFIPAAALTHPAAVLTHPAAALTSGKTVNNESHIDDGECKPVLATLYRKGKGKSIIYRMTSDHIVYITTIQTMLLFNTMQQHTMGEVTLPSSN